MIITAHKQCREKVPKGRSPLDSEKNGIERGLITVFFCSVCNTLLVLTSVRI